MVANTLPLAKTCIIKQNAKSLFIADGVDIYKTSRTKKVNLAAVK